MIKKKSRLRLGYGVKAWRTFCSLRWLDDSTMRRPATSAIRCCSASACARSRRASRTSRAKACPRSPGGVTSATLHPCTGRACSTVASGTGERAWPMAKKKGREHTAGMVEGLDPGAARVVQRAEAEGLELIRFLYVDHGGVVRGKATSRSRLAERLTTGIGLTLAMQAMTMLDELQVVDGMGPVGEIRLLPDPPGAGAMVADMIKLDGQPWEACPRSFLKDAIAALAGEGYALVAAFEPEFTLGRREPAPPDEPGGLDRLVPVDQSLCFSTTGFGAAHDYAVELVRALEAQGM